MYFYKFQNVFVQNKNVFVQISKKLFVKTSSVRQLDRGGWIVLGYIMQCEVITRGEGATLTWHDPLIMASAGGEGCSFNVVLVVRRGGHFM